MCPLSAARHMTLKLLRKNSVCVFHISFHDWEPLKFCPNSLEEFETLQLKTGSVTEDRKCPPCENEAMQSDGWFQRRRPFVSLLHFRQNNISEQTGKIKDQRNRIKTSSDSRETTNTTETHLFLLFFFSSSSLLRHVTVTVPSRHIIQTSFGQFNPAVTQQHNFTNIPSLTEARAPPTTRLRPLARQYPAQGRLISPLSGET